MICGNWLYSMLLCNKDEFCEIVDEGLEEEDVDEDDEIFCNPVEQYHHNRIFANPTKRHAKEAPKSKKMHKLTNERMDNLLSAKNLEKYKSEKEVSEFFALPLWSYKEFKGEKYVGEVPPGQKKNGGSYTKKYGSFFSRRRDFQKTLLALSWCIRWRKKY